jgi:hypothetical protein
MTSHLSERWIELLPGSNEVTSQLTFHELEVFVSAALTHVGSSTHLHLPGWWILYAPLYSLDLYICTLELDLLKSNFEFPFYCIRAPVRYYPSFISACWQFTSHTAKVKRVNIKSISCWRDILRASCTVSILQFSRIRPSGLFRLIINF